jgi:hypothetical protein
MNFETHELRLKKSPSPLRSLVWMGDELVDWVGGGSSHRLDGTYEPIRVNYAYRFDAAIVSSSHEFALIYERSGTKALVLRHGTIVRELNRSFYCADAYEYPIAFLRLSSGQEVIAHCPDEYNQLEIEDAATGQRLTRAESRKPVDCFFSRLVGSPSGAYLASAGWVWHPLDIANVFDVSEGLRDVTHLDGGGIKLDFKGEVSSVCFGPADTFVVNDTMDFDNGPSGPENHRLRRFDLATRRMLSEVTPSTRIGEMMSVGQHHIVNFYEHPKLVSLQTGAVEHAWPEIHTDCRISSFVVKDESPMLALDPENLRFAVAGKEAIHVVQLTPR